MYVCMYVYYKQDLALNNPSGLVCYNISTKLYKMETLLHSLNSAIPVFIDYHFLPNIYQNFLRTRI